MRGSRVFFLVFGLLIEDVVDEWVPVAMLFLGNYLSDQATRTTSTELQEEGT